MVKLNEWEIREPSNAKSYTNQNEVVIVEDRGKSIMAKMIVVKDRITIVIDGMVVNVLPESKIIDIK